MSETKTQNPSSPNAQLDNTDFVNEVFGRKHGEHLDAATIEVALTSLPAMYESRHEGAGQPQLAIAVDAPSTNGAHARAS
jgi:hypothetical protein